MLLEGCRVALVHAIKKRGSERHETVKETVLILDLKIRGTEKCH